MRYLLVETASPMDQGLPFRILDMALELAAGKINVDLWFMQNGVLILKQDDHDYLPKLYSSNYISVFFDDISLEMRRIKWTNHNSNGNKSNMKCFTSQLMRDNSKPIWHYV